MTPVPPPLRTRLWVASGLALCALFLTAAEIAGGGSARTVTPGARQVFVSAGRVTGPVEQAGCLSPKAEAGM